MGNVTQEPFTVPFPPENAAFLMGDRTFPASFFMCISCLTPFPMENAAFPTGNGALPSSVKLR